MQLDRNSPIAGRPAKEVRDGLLAMLTALALLASAPLAPADAQLQPGPNLLPGGVMATFSPRFGYFGPPAAIYPVIPEYREPRLYLPPPPPPRLKPPPRAYGKALAPPLAEPAPTPRRQLSRPRPPLPGPFERAPEPAPTGPTERIEE